MALLSGGWDRRSPARQRAVQARALRAQVVDVVGPSSPFWRQRLAALGRRPEQVATPEALRSLPAVGERDVCPDGDPGGAAALVLQAAERDWALHAEGPDLRRALLRRLVAPRSYTAQVEADTRATSFALDGLAVRFPVASTRADLDLVARSGARAWSLLGLGRADVLVGLVPDAATARALELAALASGAPAALARDEEELAELLALLPATVLVLPSEDAAELLAGLDAGEQVRLVLVLGGPHEAAAVREALGPGVDVLPLHRASAHRLLWVPCRESAAGTADVGLHLSPDLELVQLVDPETGADAGSGTREVVLTQLGLRGSALLRWRTGDLAEDLREGACPACRRTVTRLVGLRPAALVPWLRRGPVDLRALTAALAGRPDLAAWRVEIDARSRLLVHVDPARGADATATCVAVAGAVREATGSLPAQVVLAAEGLPRGVPLTPRVVRTGR